MDLEPINELADEQLLLNTIRRHLEVTGSPRAKWILENWATMLPLFVKVFPHEFKRVLRKQATHGSKAIPASVLAGAKQAAHG